MPLSPLLNSYSEAVLVCVPDRKRHRHETGVLNAADKLPVALSSCQTSATTLPR
jgi:hypothetical protein